MRARYINQLTAADVGQRVSVRRWVPDAERGARPSDVLGHLEAFEDEVLLVRRADGELVEVSTTDVLAARVIPPAPTRGPRPSTEDGPD